MATHERAALTALLLTPGAGRAATYDALAAAQAARAQLHELLGLPARRLIERLPPGQDETAALIARCSPAYRKRAETLLERVRRIGAKTILATENAYPEGLRHFLGRGAPPILFVHGDAALLGAPAAAVVGARRVSWKGAALAAKSAAALARADLTLISGGARGVDTKAHDAAIKAHGTTIIVLPQGILTYHPTWRIRRAVKNGQALVLSGFLPDARWQTHAAVTRNATISALARMVCVIEPKKRGGSIRTARCALEHGKRVLVYCNPAQDPPCDELRRRGALDLLDPHGKFDPTRLLRLWHEAPQAAPTQTELF